MAVLELVRRHRQAQKRDQSISSDSGKAAGRDQGLEGVLAREDGADEHRAENKHYSNRVARLAIRRHAADPRREWKCAIAGHGKDEAGRSNNSDTRSLRESGLSRCS